MTGWSDLLGGKRPWDGHLDLLISLSGGGTVTGSQLEPVIQAARTLAGGVEQWLVARSLGEVDLARAILELSCGVALMTAAEHRAPDQGGDDVRHALEQMRQMLNALDKAVKAAVHKALQNNVTSPVEQAAGMSEKEKKDALSGT